MPEVIVAIDECRSQLSAAPPAAAAFGGPLSLIRPASVLAPQKPPRFFSKRPALVAAALAAVGLIALAAVIVIRIKTENGKTGITVETEHDVPAVTAKDELGGANRSGPRSPAIPVAQVSGVGSCGKGVPAARW
jgi:anti-sigma factor RsiW